jgi:hypothetical protein
MSIKQVKLPASLTYPVRIDKVHVEAGLRVEKGQAVYTATDDAGRTGTVKAPVAGEIVEGPVPPGAAFAMAMPVLAIRPTQDAAADPAVASDTGGADPGPNFDWLSDWQRAEPMQPSGPSAAPAPKDAAPERPPDPAAGETTPREKAPRRDRVDPQGQAEGPGSGHVYHQFRPKASATPAAPDARASAPTPKQEITPEPAVDPPHRADRRDRRPVPPGPSDGIGLAASDGDRRPGRPAPEEEWRGRAIGIILVVAVPIYIFARLIGYDPANLPLREALLVVAVAIGIMAAAMLVVINGAPVLSKGRVAILLLLFPLVWLAPFTAIPLQGVKAPFQGFLADRGIVIPTPANRIVETRYGVPLVDLDRLGTWRVSRPSTGQQAAFDAYVRESQ